MVKIRDILTKSEINLLIKFLKTKKEQLSSNAYYLDLIYGKKGVGDTSGPNHWKFLIATTRYAKKGIRNIRKKLKQNLETAELDGFDLEKYKEKLCGKGKIYTKKDFPEYLKKSEEFFCKTGTFKIVDMDRVYLGMSFEFLLKSAYLKRGYCINPLLRDQKTIIKTPCTFRQVKKNQLDQNRTVDLKFLIANLEKILPVRYKLDPAQKGYGEKKKHFERLIKAGPITAQFWRNNDMHFWPRYRSIDSAQIQHVKNSYQNIRKIFFPKIK